MTLKKLEGRILGLEERISSHDAKLDLFLDLLQQNYPKSPSIGQIKKPMGRDSRVLDFNS